MFVDWWVIAESTNVSDAAKLVPLDACVSGMNGTARLTMAFVRKRADCSGLCEDMPKCLFAKWQCAPAIEDSLSSSHA